MTNGTQRKLVAAGAMLLALVLAFAGFSSWVAYAQGPMGGDGDRPCWGDGVGPWGMMGGGVWGGNGYGPGTMGGGMMGGNGYGPGMMGGMGMMGGGMWNEDCPFADGMMMGDWPSFEAAGPVNTLDEAIAVAERFIAAWNDDNLVLGEVMQFDNQFYAQAIEQDSGRGAFEFLIDPQTGAVMPEPGPNMMWNARYGVHGEDGAFGDMMDGSGYGPGMMGGQGMMDDWMLPEGADGVEMPLSAEDAVQAAQAYLARAYPDLSADTEATAFYGYYTLHVLKDGEIVGMLSVNGYSGRVFPHMWHGEFLGMEHVAGEEHGS